MAIEQDNPHPIGNNVNDNNGDAGSSIRKNRADEKLTLTEEADLTPEDVEEMEQEHAEEFYQRGKGSSGPEEKDIA